MKKIKNLILDSPYLLLIFGFLSVILLGTILLMRPFVTRSGESTSFLNALFTATSATCVTGLVVLDTGTYFNEIGHTIIMFLIQIGGIGIIAFIILSIKLLKGKLSIKNKLSIQETYNTNGLGDTSTTLKFIFIISLCIEIVGALILSFVFVPEHGFRRGIFYSLFHSISAFNNAGFDLNGNFSSLTNYVGNTTVNIVTILLILLGSIGFLVILDMYKNRSFKKLSLNSKVVLTSTVIILFIGFVLFLIFEMSNPETIGKLNWNEKILASLFLSTTPKTAGYNTINMSGLTIASSFLVIILMFVGASPSSTGGGLKTTTVIIPLLSVLALFKGKEDVEIFERRIPKNLVSKSIALITIVFIITICSVMLLSFTENADFMTLLFEVASAINTVGLSLGFTPALSAFGKCLIILLMFIGRIGPLTILTALSMKQKSSTDNRLKFVEEKLLIG